MRIKFAVIAMLAVLLLSAEAHSRAPTAQDEWLDYMKLKAKIMEDELDKQPPKDPKNPCNNNRLAVLTTIELDTAQISASMIPPSYRKDERQWIAIQYIKIASRLGDLGCIHIERTLYLKVMEDFPEPEFEGIRQRAQVGLDEIKARTNGVPDRDMPWPAGSKQ